jgi:hypothetical protein
MDKTQLYVVIRQEIVANHVLMHIVSIIVVVSLVFGAWLVEQRRTILSVLLPLLAISWAGAMVRFEFLIHRQGSYLRELERYLRSSEPALPTWELWKANFTATQIVMPLADIFTLIVVFVAAVYLSFGPARDFLATLNPRLSRAYPWVVMSVLSALICALAVIPLALRN